mgnify:CR=1 FL=1
MEPSKHKLFYYNWIGELTFLAGVVNVCAILLLELTITHSTGNICKAAIALANGEFNAFSEILFYIILFFIGSTISGYIYHEKKTDITKYDAILPILFGIIMFIAIKTTTDNKAILRIISLGMGIQNGTYIKLKGIMVRTTHMTGYITDAGFCLGSLLHGNHEDAWKLRFYIISIFAFFLGGFASVLLIKHIDLKTIEVTAALYCIHGLYMGYKYFKVKQNEVQADI